MPVYCYKCPDCEETFEIRHSMGFDDQVCIYCSSESVFRQPSLSNKKLNHITTKTKPGKIVDEYILEAKEEIKTEKRDLRSKEI